MNYVVRLTPEAEDTFDALSKQLLSRWGEQYVLEFEDRVSKAFELLSPTPFIYPVVLDELQVRKCIIHKNCSVFCKIFGQTVVVICFSDNRQDPIFFDE